MSKETGISMRSGFAELFIKRPILALVINLLIAVAGLAAFSAVDVRELPNVDQPVLSVNTQFDGAAPETIDTEITTPLEDAVSALEGLQSVSSRSSYGRSRINLEFSDGVDINDVANEAREIVARTLRQLPDESEDPTVTKNDSDADPIIRLALMGGTSLEVLTELAEGLVSDRVSTIEGISEVKVSGDQVREFQVYVNMVSLTGRGLTPDDMEEALSTLRATDALGDLDSEAQSVVMRSTDPLVDAATISNLLIDGNTRIGDVAFVQLSASERSTLFRVNGESAVGLNIIRQSVGNTLAISQAVREAVEELQPQLPDGIRLLVNSDDGIFIEQSISEVVFSISMAVLIVISVIFVFLRSFSATMIPAVAIPIALTGTLAAIWLAGFSVNTISLLALVLATGMVVDDAIVVVENIVRKRRSGMGPRAAAVAGTNEVFFAVISTTATLAAVFIPISFLPGQAGGIFSEFGFVLAFCVTLSSIVALTLVPAMAAILDPGRDSKTDAAEQPRESIFSRGYGAIVDFSLRMPVIIIGIAVAFAIFAASSFQTLPSELTPREDRGFFIISSRAPSGASLSFTDSQVRQVETILQPYIENGEMASVLALVGRGASSSAFIIIRLQDWVQRTRSQQEIASEINERLRRITGLTLSVRTPNSLGIRGAGRGLQFAVTGNDYDGIVQAGDELVRAMAQEPDFFVNPQLGYDTSQPQVAVSIDRELATRLGLTVKTINSIINTMSEGTTATTVIVDGKEIDIQLLPAGAPINDPGDLERVFVQTASGNYVPLSTAVTLTQTASAAQLSREGGDRAVPVQTNMATGVDLSAAAARAQELAREILPADMGIIFLAEAAALDESQRSTLLVFGVALLIVFLVLAAQFESFGSAIIIMLTVPFGLAAAVLAISLTGGSLNYYSQIGLVMLIGIMAKNGILIVEFANQLREQGQNVDSAIRDAVRLRFRPVMMTMISTVFGGLPLVFASGAGAEARIAVGWVVVGGLGFATVFTLFLTPVFYRLIAPICAVPGASSRKLENEIDATAARTDSAVAPAE
jgi:hydrophobe/amphiphile efflux-1 (HAE1) family protein